MVTAEKIRVNYFVGGGLALGGDLWLEASKLVFSPTGAIDRAMGAKEVEIPFEDIKGLEYTGSLSRSFHVKTDKKVHKFEGAQAKRAWEALEKALPNKELITLVTLPTSNGSKNGHALSCDQCKSVLQPGYSFCPNCSSRVKSACNGCHKTVDPVWSACAFCGWKLPGAIKKAA